MSETLQQLQDQLAALDKALMDPTSLVSAGDMTVRRDTTNLAKAREILLAKIDLASGVTTRTRMSFTRIGMRRF
ncbi:hypothetical protein [Muricoccus aerilatus]|uniref:hypothetical protein n=1 Tax=Muricoccus aerilatus TaxID=452982 RepID=UPI0005C210B5|nr:hypothetical protein [Roseomonas aerilata]